MRSPEEFAAQAKASIDEAMTAKQAGNQQAAYALIANATQLGNLAVMTQPAPLFDHGGYL